MQHNGAREFLCSLRQIVWANDGSVRTVVLHVPPARVLVTELARGRMGHTAGSNNTHSTGQTVSQNNFIVSEIEVVRKAGTWKGRGFRKVRRKKKDAKPEKEGLVRWFV
ncbi:hypothetical protein FQA47_018201 [Oryzias melastigma]|uniref:Uncharacterized protein n=1 Tax=Oryzias melastigma TaxID=30732 RepID=A0A834F8X0_ORYME|nr:hypothetical protein FQA47_018201 [Oryzias melastigma]